MAEPDRANHFRHRLKFDNMIGDITMKNFRNIISAALALSLTLSLTACGGKTETPADDSTPAQTEKYLIGIAQYGEHASLDNCRIGFLQGLAEAGLVEGTDFEVDYQNAGFDDAIDAQIGQSFSAADVDLMVGIATPSAVACYNAAEDKDIPVVFTAVTDPAAAKLDSGNITGTSDKLPVEAQLDLIRALQPEAKYWCARPFGYIDDQNPRYLYSLSLRVPRPMQ